jgi:mannose-6-phosphate isomerase-like protein (cupin superfamily)
MTLSPVNLNQKLSSFTDQWSPKVIGAYNGNDLMVVKVKGEFVWHSHPDTDDFFMVLKGDLTIRMREGDVALAAGEIFVVPKGVEHCPFAHEECHLLLIEPRGTPNTGNEATAVKKVAI